MRVANDSVEFVVFDVVEQLPEGARAGCIIDSIAPFRARQGAAPGLGEMAGELSHLHVLGFREE